MTSVDLLFPVVGSWLATDHGYPLYAAVTRLLPALHRGEFPFGLIPVTGQYAGGGRLYIDPSRSRLRLRIPASQIPSLLPLSGRRLEVGGRSIQLGAPEVRMLQPAERLFAPSVTIKHAEEPVPFMDAAHRQLRSLGVAARLVIPTVLFGPWKGEPRRHILRIKDSSIVCFPLLAQELSPSDSLRLQEIGLGGRRHMGAGLFVPAGDLEVSHAV